jgi:hypothetical protein
MEEQKRPHFWMWGQATTVKNPIRERWEAQHRAQPMTEEAKAACAQYRKEHPKLRRVRRRSKR